MSAVKWLGGIIAAVFVVMTLFLVLDEVLDWDRGYFERERRAADNARFLQEREQERQVRFAQTVEVDEREEILLNCLEDGWRLKGLEQKVRDELIDSRTFEPGAVLIDQEAGPSGWYGVRMLFSAKNVAYKYQQEMVAFGRVRMPACQTRLDGLEHYEI